MLQANDQPVQHRFGCVPFKGKKDGKRFYVLASTFDDAIKQAKEETSKTEFDSVFIETKTGRQVYEGPIA